MIAKKEKLNCQSNPKPTNSKEIPNIMMNIIIFFLKEVELFG